MIMLSLGSNLNPEQNICLIIEQLLEISPQIAISSIGETAALGFESEHYFLNLAAVIQSTMPLDALKKKLNAIEEKLGRNRSDPNSKVKDRVADIDILFEFSKDKKLYGSIIPTESYVQPFVMELLDQLQVKYIAKSDINPTPHEVLWGKCKIGLYPLIVQKEFNEISCNQNFQTFKREYL